MARVMLVEPDERLIDDLTGRLEGRGFLVTNAATLEGGLRLVGDEGPDILILAVDLEAHESEEILRTAKAATDAAVIVVGSRGTRITHEDAIALGADAYFKKPIPIRPLMGRIRALLRAHYCEVLASGTGAVEAGRIRLDPAAHEVTVAEEPIHLALKEFRLLQLLMENYGRVLMRETLLDRVWGPDYLDKSSPLDSRTLDVHIKRICEKCEEDSSSPRHVVTVRGVGCMFRA